MMTSFSFVECVEMFLQIAELFGVICPFYVNSTLEEVESTRTIFLYLLIRYGISSHFERHAKTSCTCGIFRFIGISLFPPTPYAMRH